MLRAGTLAPVLAVMFVGCDQPSKDDFQQVSKKLDRLVDVTEKSYQQDRINGTRLAGVLGQTHKFHIDYNATNKSLNSKVDIIAGLLDPNREEDPDGEDGGAAAPGLPGGRKPPPTLAERGRDLGGEAAGWLEEKRQTVSELNEAEAALRSRFGLPADPEKKRLDEFKDDLDSVKKDVETIRNVQGQVLTRLGDLEVKAARQGEEIGKIRGLATEEAVRALASRVSNLAREQRSRPTASQLQRWLEAATTALKEAKEKVTPALVLNVKVEKPPETVLPAKDHPKHVVATPWAGCGVYHYVDPRNCHWVWGDCPVRRW